MSQRESSKFVLTSLVSCRINRKCRRLNRNYTHQTRDIWMTSRKRPLSFLVEHAAAWIVANSWDLHDWNSNYSCMQYRKHVILAKAWIIDCKSQRRLMYLWYSSDSCMIWLHSRNCCFPFVDAIFARLYIPLSAWLNSAALLPMEFRAYLMPFPLYETTSGSAPAIIAHG